MQIQGFIRIFSRRRDDEENEYHEKHHIPEIFFNLRIAHVLKTPSLWADVLWNKCLFILNPSSVIFRSNDRHHRFGSTNCIIYRFNGCNFQLYNEQQVMLGSKANFDQSEARKVTNKNLRMRSSLIIGIGFSVNLTWINASWVPTYL